jgi:phage terminase small subunit
MNDRQRKFAELVVQGRPASRAYQEAGYSATGNSAEALASKLLRHEKVSAYIEELRGEVRAASKFTREAKLEGIYEIYQRNKLDDPRVALAAIAEENKMTGDHAAEKIEVEADITIKIGE